MSAAEVTDTAIGVIECEPQRASNTASGDEPRADDDPDVAVLNYANPDMVGHTGDFEAAVTGVAGRHHDGASR